MKRVFLLVTGFAISCQMLSGVDDLSVDPQFAASGGTGTDADVTPVAGADAGTSDCAEPCSDGQVCHEGRCVSPTADGDGDGIPALSDCDDNDEAVGTTAETPCESECASGKERCVLGKWEACDAPADCSCVPTDSRALPCGNCGTQTQNCNDQGIWENYGLCTAEGVCERGTKEMVGACGNCGTAYRTCKDDCQWDIEVCEGEGECMPEATENEDASCGVCGQAKARSRSCTAACGWGTWGDWGACSEVPGCTPGETDTTPAPSQKCGNCGTQSRAARTCTDECVWGSWGAWGTCTGQGVCAPTAVETTTGDCKYCGEVTGTRSGSRTCTSACSWGLWSWGTCTAPRECAYCCPALDRYSEPYCAASSRDCASTCPPKEPFCIPQ